MQMINEGEGTMLHAAEAIKRICLEEARIVTGLGRIPPTTAAGGSQP